MRFEFATASRIVFGPGTVQEVPASAREMGNRAMQSFYLRLLMGSKGQRPPFMCVLAIAPLYLEIGGR